VVTGLCPVLHAAERLTNACLWEGHDFSRAVNREKCRL